MNLKKTLYEYIRSYNEKQIKSRLKKTSLVKYGVLILRLIYLSNLYLMKTLNTNWAI
ncbi:IS3 family transposase [Glaesserella sp.]|uniref:IS3 family transposase n=1 Tax=Glaesserella sp. TaxID=2094731 RepID=UPI00359F83A1